tara:strand:- start:777 stop:1670 length:894 start_codon:yes stop_codon:yes gene_type:complete
MQIGTLKKELEVIQKKSHEFEDVIQPYDRVIILGNGGSNSVASHIAQDYTKILGKKAISFSDSSRLTCYINDYGRDEAYVEFIKHFWERGTMVILISSSGNSMNIVNTAQHCIDNDYPYMALSGFDKDNKLNTLGRQHFRYHVNSHDYGVVESAHLIMLHSILPKSEVRGVIAGAFDLIHPGYVKMFKEAKKHCTHLTVALHEDPSLENGKRKPIHSLEEREEILRSITYVDDIRIYWNEYGLSQYLQVGKFDVRFLGDDYKDKDYTGKDLDLKIIWIDRNHSYSTTRLKKLIKDNE